MIIERAGVFIAQSEVDCGGGSHLPTVFDEAVAAPVAQIHLRDAGLALLDGRKRQQQAGQTGAAAIVEAILGRVSIGELVVAAVLKKAPHRPDEPPRIAAELRA